MASRHIIAPRTDENEQARQLTKKAIKETTTRAALGNLGNKIIINQDVLKDKDNAKKTTFQNVKPRVDTHWKKSTNVVERPITTIKPVTRADTLRTHLSVPSQHVTVSLKPTSVAAKTTAQEKPITTAKVSSSVLAIPAKTSTISKRSTKVTLKREESHVNKRTLIKLKAQKALKKSSGSSGSSSNVSEKSDDDEKIVISSSDNEMELNRPSSHSTKQIEDIDANDVCNPLLVSEYVNDIYYYLYHMEKKFAIKENYLDKHKEITHKMRAILIDWINEVHCQFKLESETYYMAVSLIDRYLQSVEMTPKKQLQLVGVTAMFIASKYEELFPPDIQDFVYITDDTYNKRQILEMEKQIVFALDFNLGKPLPIHFLRRFSKAAKAEDPNHLLGKYLIELSTIDYSLTHFKPSEIAAAALYISLTLEPLPSNTDSSKIWNDTLEHYTTYTVNHLKPIIQKLAQMTKSAPQLKMQSVYSKYSHSKYDKISKMSELYGSKMDRLISGHFSS